MNEIKKDKTFSVRISTRLFKDFDKAIKAQNAESKYEKINRNSLVVDFIRKWVTFKSGF